MITIRIDRKRYKGVYSWSDMRLSRFCALASIPRPDGYEDFVRADGKFSPDDITPYIEAVSKITEKQIKVTFPAYYRNVIGCLTNIPDKAVLSPELINELYEVYFKPFVVSLIYHTPVIHFMGQVTDYQPEMRKSFRIGLRRFSMPETVNINDQMIPLQKEPILTYTEASDIFKDMRMTKEDIKRIALFMAIYCRRKGEKYSEKKALKRQAAMMRVRMSDVWSVFFYTLRRLPSSVLCIRLFGGLLRTVEETVLEAQTFKSMAAGV